MFAFPVFGFRAFADLSEFTELNKKHIGCISQVLIFGSHQNQTLPTPQAT